MSDDCGCGGDSGGGGGDTSCTVDSGGGTTDYCNSGTTDHCGGGGFATDHSSDFIIDYSGGHHYTSAFNDNDAGNTAGITHHRYRYGRSNDSLTLCVKIILSCFGIAFLSFAILFLVMMLN